MGNKKTLDEFLFDGDLFLKTWTKRLPLTGY